MLAALSSSTPGNATFAPDASGQLPLAGLGGVCAPLQAVAGQDDVLVAGLPGLPLGGQYAPMSTQTCAGAGGIVQVVGLFVAWTPARPSFISSVGVRCRNTAATISPPTAPDSNYRPWSYTCPAGNVLMAVMWEQQVLPSPSLQPFLTSVIFRCGLAAPLPYPSPTASGTFNSTEVSNLEQLSLQCPTGQYVTSIYGRYDAATTLGTANTYLRELGIVCSGPAAVTRDVDSLVSPSAGSSVPFAGVDCPAGVASLVGRALPHPSAVNKPGVLLSVDALCYDTIDHTSQLQYSPDFKVGAGYAESCRMLTLMAGLTVLRSKFTLDNQLTTSNTTFNTSFLHGIKLLCVDVPETESNTIIAAQLPARAVPAVPGTPFRYECPQGSKVVSAVAMMDSSRDLLSLRIECDNAVLSPGVQSLEAIAAIPLNANTSSDSSTLTDSTTSVSNQRYISPEMVAAPPRSAFLVQKTCPLGFAGTSGTLGFDNPFSDGRVLPAATLDLVATPGVRAYLYDVLLDWNQAADFCKSQGGLLMYYKSDFERDALTVMLQEWASGGVVDVLLGVWIGANRIGPGLYDFAYNDDTVLISAPPAYVPTWGPNEPNDLSNVEDCVEMVVNATIGSTITSYWVDRACHGVVRRPLCRVVPKSLRPGISTSDAAVPAVQLTSTNGDQLLMYDVALTWDAAQTFCQRRGAKLASFNDQNDLSIFSAGLGLYFNMRRSAATSARTTVWSALRNQLPGPGSPINGLRSARAAVQLGSREYLWIEAPQAFDQASGWCRANGGELASFDSTSDFEYVMSALQSTRRTLSIMWIGLRSTGGDGGAWLDGSPSTFRKWQVDEDYPLSDGEDACVVVLMSCMTIPGVPVVQLPCNSTFVRRPCWPEFDFVSGFICARQTLATASTIFGPSGRQFLSFSGPSTWADASQTCRNSGGTLASFHSAVELSSVMVSLTANMAFLNAMNMTSRGATLQSNPGLIYIGLRRVVGVPTAWQWSSGRSFSFAAWGSNQPNGTVQDACVGLRLTCLGANGTWSNCTAAAFDDVACDLLAPFICVRELTYNWAYSDGTALSFMQQPGNLTNMPIASEPSNHLWVCNTPLSNTAFVGSPIVTFNGLSGWGACCRACSTVSLCRNWNWVTNTNTSQCLLYGDSGYRFVNVIGSVTGVSGAPPVVQPGTSINTVQADCGAINVLNGQDNGALNFYFTPMTCNLTMPVACRRSAVADPRDLPEEERTAINRYMQPMATVVTKSGQAELALYDAYMDNRAAKDLCTVLGGALVEPSTDEVAADATAVAVEALLTRDPNLFTAFGPQAVQYFIGLEESDKATEGTWQWNSGAKLGVSSWAANEPGDTKSAVYTALAVIGEDCAVGTVSGATGTSSWSDVPCAFVARRPLCQRPITAAPDSAVLRSQAPVAQSVQENAHFMLFALLMDWVSAELFCQAQGGHLASFDSALQYDQVSTMVVEWMQGNTRTTTLGVWIGLNDRVTEATWRYSATPTALADVSWARWAPGAGATKPVYTDVASPVATPAGSNTPWATCAFGQYVKSISARVDRRSSGLDLMGMVALRMTCGSASGTSLVTINSGDSFDAAGIISSWGADTTCNTNMSDYVVGVQLKLANWGDSFSITYVTTCYFFDTACFTIPQPVSTYIDDTAVNSLRVVCRYGATAEIGNPGLQGSWGGVTQCPSGSYVCGYTLRQVSYMSGTSPSTSFTADNTGVNGLNLRCCVESPLTINDCVEARFTRPTNSTTGTSSWIDQPCTTTASTASINNLLCRRTLATADALTDLDVRVDGGVRQRGGSTQAGTVPTVDWPLPTAVALAVQPVATVQHIATATTAGSLTTEGCGSDSTCISAFREGSQTEEFLLFDVPMPWQSAESFCKAQNAELFYFTAADYTYEVRDVGILIKSWAIGRSDATVVLWFGASTTGGTAPWRYTSGDTLSTSSWAVGSESPSLPSCGALEFPVFLGSRMIPSWSAVSCKMHRRFICRRAVASRPAPSLSGVPAASVLVLHVRTSIYRQQVTWRQADQFCQQQLGNLASMTSADEADTMVAMVREWARNNRVSGTTRVWLGALYSGSFGRSWTWTDGSAMSYTRGAIPLGTRFTLVDLCVVWLISVQEGAGAVDAWAVEPCDSSYAIPMCQMELVPFICNNGSGMDRPVDASANADTYCPPSTVITGISGIVPPLSTTVGLRSLHFAGICGNPQAPVTLQRRDESRGMSCRFAWSVPREEADTSVAMTYVNETSAGECAAACGVASARSQSAYIQPLLSVLYTDGTCRCARALSGLQLSADSVSAVESLGNDTNVVYAYGTQSNVYALCTVLDQARVMVQPTTFQIDLTDLGWTPRLTALVRDSKYRLFTKGTDWEGAQRMCTLHGGHLAVLEDLQDVQDVLSIMTANVNATGLAAGAELWVGLFQAQRSVFRWVDGHPLGYNITFVDEWDYAPPQCGSVQLAATTVSGRLTMTGSVQAGSCAWNKPFICETSTIVDDSLDDITPGEERLVTGLFAGLGTWYVTLYNAHSVSWYDAQRICRYQNKDLMWFFNKEEQDWFSAWVRTTNLTSGVWTALAHDAVGGVRTLAWRSNTGTPSLGLSTWRPPADTLASALPNLGAAAGICGQLDPYDTTGQNVLRPCGESRAFACKRGGPWARLPASANATAVPSPPPPPPPPGDGSPAPYEFTHLSTRYTFSGSKRRTWDAAQQDCRQQGGRLAEFVTVDEFKVVAKAIGDYWHGSSSAQYQDFWIGLRRDADQPNVFRYDSGNIPAASATAWGKDQPDNWGFAESCVQGRIYETDLDYLFNELRSELQAAGGIGGTWKNKELLNLINAYRDTRDIFYLQFLTLVLMTPEQRMRLSEPIIIWNDLSCGAEIPFVCSAAIIPPATLVPNPMLDLIEFQTTVAGQHFSMYGTLVDWAGAKTFCEAQGQTLADWSRIAEYWSLRDAFTHWLPTRPYLTEPTLSLWTGYNYLSSGLPAGSMVTANGMLVSSTTGYYVAPDTVSGTPDKQCVVLAANPRTSQWAARAEACSAKFRPLCRSETSAIAPTFVSDTINGRKYQFFKEARTWGRAREVCKTFNQGELATFRTDAEWTSAKPFIQQVWMNNTMFGSSFAWNAISVADMVAGVSMTRATAWAGFNDMFTPGFTMPGDPTRLLEGNQAWALGQPAKTSDCGFISAFAPEAQRFTANASDSNWWAGTCQSQLAFFCVFTPPATPVAVKSTGLLPVATLFELGTHVTFQGARGAYIYTMVTDTTIRANFTQAQLMCQLMPSTPGVLATVFTNEDLFFFAQVAARAESQVSPVWLGFADFLSPGTPYWTSTNLAALTSSSANSSAWTKNPANVSGEVASCGYLDPSDLSLRRAPCSSNFSFLCMAPSSVRSPQHVALAELSGDGLPDLVVATNCPFDGGASLVGLQQPSPPTAVAAIDTVVATGFLTRGCGDGIPIWQREECDIGTDNAEGGVCSPLCRLDPGKLSVQASSREAYIAIGSGNTSLQHLGVHYNLYGQVRGFADLAAGDPLLYSGFSASFDSSVFPVDSPISVHKKRTLSPGQPYQFRAALKTDMRPLTVVPVWSDVETVPENDGRFTTFTTNCGCTTDNPGGQPVGLSVVQQFGSIVFSWTVGSACESGVSITRSRVDPNTAEVLNTTTVAQLTISLKCGTLYRPSTTEVDEDVVRDSLQVGLTYRYCVIVASDALSTFFLNASDPLNAARFVSEPICKDIKIQWTGRLKGEVRTKFDTPAPGVRLTARLVDSPYVVSGTTDDSGRYTLTLQADVATCQPVLAPEACLSQVVRLIASQRTKLRSGRLIMHSFSIGNRAGATQSVAVQHMQVVEGLRIIDESSLPIAGFVKWPGTAANSGYDQTRGCAVRAAKVCALNNRDNSTIACVTSELDGSFVVAAGIGSVVRMDVKWNNHTFATSLPPLLEAGSDGSFEIMAPVYDIDIRNIETRTLRVGLAGGLCIHALGSWIAQFTAYECDEQGSQRASYRRIKLPADTAYTDFKLPALSWDVSFVELTEPIPALSAEAVLTYLTITNQITKFQNLTAKPADDETAPLQLTFSYMAPNSLEVDVCRDYKSNFVSCGSFSLSQKCDGDTGVTASNAVYSAFRPPDSDLVRKDVVLLRRGVVYKARIRLFGSYGRLRCDNVLSDVLIQDSIAGDVETNRCSPSSQGCTQQVKLVDRTNTSEYVYDIIPGAPNYGFETAYALPLSVLAGSVGWPSRTFLLFAIVEGTSSRLGSGYIEIPIPVPLLILRDPPGDGSFATLESSISTAVKLSMGSNDRATCGGMGNTADFYKSMIWNLVNALPFAKIGKTPKIAESMQKTARIMKEVNAVKETAKISKLAGLRNTFHDVKTVVRNFFTGKKNTGGITVTSMPILHEPQEVAQGGLLSSRGTSLTVHSASELNSAKDVKSAGGLADDTVEVAHTAADGGTRAASVADDAAEVNEATQWANWGSNLKMTRVEAAVEKIIQKLSLIIKGKKYIGHVGNVQNLGGNIIDDLAGESPDATDAESTTPADPEGLELGRGAGLSLRRQKDTASLVTDFFKGAGVANDPGTSVWLLGEMAKLNEGEFHEVLGRLVKQYDDYGESLGNSTGVYVDLKTLAVGFNKDPYYMSPGNKNWGNEASKVPSFYTSTSPDFKLHTYSPFPNCEKSQLGLGFDFDLTTCVGIGAMVCAPAMRDRGTAGIITEKAFYNDEDEESYYKLTISREEGFSTPEVSSPEMTGGGGDMILAPTFAIMFILADKLEFDTGTCTPTTTMGVPTWDLKDNMDGTAWHSVWHITNVILPELKAKSLAEAGKPADQRDGKVLQNLKQGVRGWESILMMYNNLTLQAKTANESMPNYQVGQQDVNGLVQGEVEAVWHSTLDRHPDRNPEAYESRRVDVERLQESPVWKQGYFEGSEKLQQLMLRTQAYMDNTTDMGNVVVNPHAKAAVGGVVAAKQLDVLQLAYKRTFDTFSFSGGGGSYTYRLKTDSTLSTKIGFSISFKDMFSFAGGGGGGTGFWIESESENQFGFELEFDSQLLQETDRTRTVTVTMKDKDPGDQFLVKIKPDLAFGTPVFELLAGRSKCPYEPGTQKRQDAKLSVLGGTNVQTNLKQGDEALYEIVVENESGTDEKVELELGPDLATNNASMYLQLMGSPWISPVPFNMPGPFAKQTKAMVSARCGPRYSNATVEITAKSTCDSEEFSRVPLTLRCFRRCPEVQWMQGFPATQPLIYNASDNTLQKPITLTLYNPAYTFQKWNSHPRLAANGTRIVIEFTSPVKDAGTWRPIVQNGSIVDFAKLEDGQFGFATLNWEAWRVLDAGTFLLRFVVYCDADVGGGMDTRFAGPAISLLVDKSPPLPIFNPLWANQSGYMPGDPIFIDFSEPLDCRLPFAFSYVAVSSDLGANTVTLQPADLLPYCEGRRIGFNWSPLYYPYALMDRRWISIRLMGVQDMANNVMTRSLNMSFYLANITSRATVSVRFVLGPLPTVTRRLLFAAADGTYGIGNSALPFQLRAKMAFELDDDEALQQLVEEQRGATRKLLADANSVLWGCLGVPAGSAPPAVAITDAMQDDELQTLMLHLDAVHDPATGEDAAAGAARVVRMASDNSSCLHKGLRERFAAVRGISADAPLAQQLLSGISAEDLAAARTAAKGHPAGRQLTAAWDAQVQLLRQEAEAAATTRASGGSTAAVGPAATAATAATATSHVMGSRYVRLESRSPDGHTASAAAGDKQGWVRPSLLRQPYGGVVALLLLGNLAALLAVGAIWSVRRRARGQQLRRSGGAIGGGLLHHGSS